MSNKIRIDKSGIKDEDREIALNILKKLRIGERVFGNPAEGLKKTLKKLDQDIRDKSSHDPLDWKMSNKEDIKQLMQIKAGINGELELARYIERIVKHDPSLNGVVFFSSLSTKEEDIDEKGYIPDTDFVVAYGDNIMILDAKNLRIGENIPIYISGNFLSTPTNTIMELSPSNFFWEGVFKEEGYDVNIGGCVVIISKSRVLIFKNKEWYTSLCKPIYIGDLREYLINWISSIKDKYVSLKLLTTLSKMQIKKTKSDIDFGKTLNRFFR